MVRFTFPTVRAAGEFALRLDAHAIPRARGGPGGQAGAIAVDVLDQRLPGNGGADLKLLLTLQATAQECSPNGWRMEADGPGGFAVAALRREGTTQ